MTFALWHEQLVVNKNFRALSKMAMEEVKLIYPLCQWGFAELSSPSGLCCQWLINEACTDSSRGTNISCPWTCLLSLCVMFGQGPIAETHGQCWVRTVEPLASWTKFLFKKIQTFLPNWQFLIKFISHNFLSNTITFHTNWQFLIPLLFSHSHQLQCYVILIICTASLYFMLQFWMALVFTR